MHQKYIALYVCSELKGDNERRAVLLCKNWSASRQNALDAFPGSPVGFYNSLVDKRHKVLRKVMATAGLRFLDLKGVHYEDAEEGDGTRNFTNEELLNALATSMKNPHPRKRGVSNEDWLESLDEEVRDAVKFVQDFQLKANRDGFLRSVL
jgi:hypothetical protein